MKTLMRNGRDRRSENPFLGHAKKERVGLFGTDQRITSGPAARRPHSKAEYMTAPERFADSQIPLAPRAPSIHDPQADMQPRAGQLRPIGSRCYNSRSAPLAHCRKPGLLSLVQSLVKLCERGVDRCRRLTHG